MKKDSILSVLLLGTLFSAFCFSQACFSQSDSILFLNGKVFKGDIKSVDNGIIQIDYLKGKKSKSHEVNQYRLFSYFNDGKNTVTYTQDDFLGHFLTVQEAQAATFGCYDARHTFKPRMAFWTSYGVSASMVVIDTYFSHKAYNDPDYQGTATPGFYEGRPGAISILAPIAMTGIWTIPNTRVKQKLVLHKNYHGDLSYYRGYNRIARQKRVLAALRGGLLGLVTGYASYFIIHPLVK